METLELLPESILYLEKVLQETEKTHEIGQMTFNSEISGCTCAGGCRGGCSSMLV